MTNTIYLITGVNRGLGRGLLVIFLSRPNTTVIAGVRDPTSPSSQSLQTMSSGTPSKLIMVKIDSGSPTDPAVAVQHLQVQEIAHIDIAIANSYGKYRRHGTETVLWCNVRTKFTATDMGTAPARKVGLEKPFQTVEALYTRRSHGTLRQRPNFLGG
ncbi:uncharacterized protein ATNIH1004_000906 [Aspergillus tanneri]|uniref:Ketoreductase (KR) domain-containing protein n=1 Tax=Aspergillus tanneri TaxID=1220188 RepID=A0A5M9N167_9EURO|nr:uncharacterized protein ATNIH1004_000906 [Aspergillus tanneri]KAA8652006.1 hypothetical protein ATNIH1004_000906 [Aspergillus tanneri]